MATATSIVKKRRKCPLVKSERVNKIAGKENRLLTTIALINAVDIELPLRKDTN